MRKLTVILLASLMTLSLAACSNQNGSVDPTKPDQTETEGSKEEKKNPDNNMASPKEIEEAIAKALGSGYLCTEDVPEEELSFGAMGYLDLTQIESYVAKQSKVPSVDIDSVIVVKCKAGYAEEAVSLFNESYAQNVNYIRQYPFAVAKVEGARLYRVDDTIVFVMTGAAADDNASAEDAAKLAESEYKKVDEAVKGLFGTLPENLAKVPAASEPGNEGEGGMIVGG